MLAWLESFLVALSMAVVKYYAAKAGKTAYDYAKEQLELLENKGKAADYESIVKKPDATREERRNAEDSAFDN